MLSRRFLCVFLCVSVRMRVCAYVFVDACVSAYMCACARVRVCVCACVYEPEYPFRLQPKSESRRKPIHAVVCLPPENHQTPGSVDLPERHPCHKPQQEVFGHMLLMSLSRGG